MAVYTILAPPARDGATPSNPLDLVFVKEDFCWPALFFAALWLIFRRMWLVLVVYVALSLVLSALGAYVGEGAPTAVMLLVHLFLALEANALRVRTLERRGFRLVGIAEGRSLEEAELRYFGETDSAAGESIPPVPPVPPAPSVPLVPPRPPGPVAPSAEKGDVVGLFPAPGGSV
jgi:hypothetical protein